MVVKLAIYRKKIRKKDDRSFRNLQLKKKRESA